MRYRLIALALALFLSMVAGAQNHVATHTASTLLSPFVAGRVPQYDEALDLADKVDALPASNNLKTILQFMFQGLEGHWDGMQSSGGTHPLMLRVSTHNSEVRAHKIDHDNYRAELDKYNADHDAYVAAGGGGSYDKNDPKLAMLNAWYNRREEWRKRLLDWKAKVDATQTRLEEASDALEIGLKEDLAQFVKDCNEFNRLANRAVKVADIDAKMAALKPQLDRDRRALEYYKDKVPGLHADVEAMAQEADQAREDGRMAAIDKAVGLALDGAIAKVGAREVAAASKVEQVEKILIKHGIKASDIKKMLSGFKNAAHSAHHTKDLLEQLGLLRDMAAAYDNTTKQQYYEALTTCLGVFVQTPLLKLIVTNFEIYSNLMYTGLSYGTAKARVNQYWKLGDSELKAIASLSGVYQKHLRQMADLKKQREAIVASG